jgi:hypothetical protein
MEAVLWFEAAEAVSWEEAASCKEAASWEEAVFRKEAASCEEAVDAAYRKTTFCERWVSGTWRRRNRWRMAATH